MVTYMHVVTFPWFVHHLLWQNWAVLKCGELGSRLVLMDYGMFIIHVLLTVTFLHKFLDVWREGSYVHC